MCVYRKVGDELYVCIKTKTLSFIRRKKLCICFWTSMTWLRALESTPLRFMLYEVLFLLDMSYLCYMLYHIFITYLYLFYISIFTLFGGDHSYPGVQIAAWNVTIEKFNQISCLATYLKLLTTSILLVAQLRLAVP